MNTYEDVRLRPPGTTYGVIHRLGLKYLPPAVARPSFAATAILAKKLWDEMFDVFDIYRQFESDHTEACQQIINLIEDYGPRIWGSDRANVVAFPFPPYPEYIKDLRWDDGLEVQQFIKDQAIELFEDRAKKRDPNARKRRPSHSMSKLSKRRHFTNRNYSFGHDSDTTDDDFESDDSSNPSELSESSDLSDDELIPYMPRIGLAGQKALQKRKRRCPYSLVVKLGYIGCNRPDRKEVPCRQMLPYCCIRSFECLETRDASDLRPHVECTHARTESKDLSSITPRLATPPLFVPVEPQLDSPVPPVANLSQPKFQCGTESTLSSRSSPPAASTEQDFEASRQPQSLSLFPCGMCREKEVVCSKEKPICWACAQLQRQCSYPRQPMANSVEQSQSTIVDEPIEAPKSNPTVSSSETHFEKPLNDAIERPSERASNKPCSNSLPSGLHANHTNHADWMSSRLEKTLLHVRAGDGWDNIVAIELGSSQYVSDFLDKVSRHLEVGRIGLLSILLPAGVTKPEKQVVHLEWGKQDTFLMLLDILQKAIGRLGVTRPVRYVLTGTATVGAWVSM